MKVITESFLRETFRKEIPKTFKLVEGQIITPSARQLLGEKGVKIVAGNEKADKKEPKILKAPAVNAVSTKYVSLDGGVFESKPEHMTRIQGNRLVPKDHPKIEFRGKIESLLAKFLMICFRSHEKGESKLTRDLESVVDLIKTIIRADIENETLIIGDLIGLKPEEIKIQCENSKEYFGIDDFLPDFEMGETILNLNMLKCDVRSVEVMAVKAFRSEFDFEKPDIIYALNLLSDAINIMMLKKRAGKYK